MENSDYSPETTLPPLLERARTFAVQAHGDQRYGEQPYVCHLDAVVALLKDFPEEIQVIGFLHDVVEDTQVPLAEIERQFGSHVASCVGVLTDEPGETRAEKKSRTYAKMGRIEGPLQDALIVKTADRLANLTACFALKRKDKLAMYLAEHDLFREAVFRPGLCDALWSRMKQVLTASDDSCSAEGIGEKFP